MPGSGSAGPGLRPQGSSGQGSLSLCARGGRVIASRARSAPGPAAVGVAGGIEPSAGQCGILASQAGNHDSLPTKVKGMN